MALKKSTKVIGYVLACVAIFSIVNFLTAGPGPTRRDSEGAAEAQSAPAVAAPAIQRELSAIIVESKKKYRQAGNELKKSAVRAQRKKAIAELLIKHYNLKTWRGAVSGWVGKLSSVGTTGDGNAYVTIDCGPFAVSTNTLEFSDAATQQTLIKSGSDLYNELADISQGSQVVFSGVLFPSRRDGFTEMSITEGGSMTDPEFLCRFTSIKGR